MKRNSMSLLRGLIALGLLSVPLSSGCSSGASPQQICAANREFQMRCESVQDPAGKEAECVKVYACYARIYRPEYLDATLNCYTSVQNLDCSAKQTPECAAVKDFTEMAKNDAQLALDRACMDRQVECAQQGVQFSKGKCAASAIYGDEVVGAQQDCLKKPCGEIAACIDRIGSTIPECGTLGFGV